MQIQRRGQIGDRAEANLAIVFDDLASGSTPLPGRLAAEGGGKRRIFAIGNYIKQRLLHPVHIWAMTVLKRLPSDGTFNRGKPIRRLLDQGHLKLYSFDLKSATDRWPLALMHDLMSCLWGPTLASAIINGTLGMNSFMVGPPVKSGNHN